MERPRMPIPLLLSSLVCFAIARAARLDIPAIWFMLVPIGIALLGRAWDRALSLPARADGAGSAALGSSGSPPTRRAYRAVRAHGRALPSQLDR